MRIAFVVPWRECGGWLCPFLPGGTIGAVISLVPTGRTRYLPPYLREFVQLTRSTVNLPEYDAVFTWELRATLAVLLRQKITRQRQFKIIVLGAIVKGNLRHILPILRGLLRDVHRIVCFSSAECETLPLLLRLPREKFVFVPSPWRAEEPVSDDGGFVLALGHSARDYPTLIRSATGTEVPLLIVAKSPRDLGGLPIPQNIRVRYNTASDETNTLIASATFVVIPLRDTDYSAGQSVLLRAMARGKAVIATDTSGIRDYGRHNETVLFVPPEDPAALRAAVLYLWNHPTERSRIGKQAAISVRDEFDFPIFARRIAEIALTP